MQKPNLPDCTDAVSYIHQSMSLNGQLSVLNVVTALYYLQIVQIVVSSQARILEIMFVYNYIVFPMWYETKLQSCLDYVVLATFCAAQKSGMEGMSMGVGCG